MNKTILIVIGLLAALITAAGIMHTRSYNRPVTYIRIEKKHICDERCTIDSSLHYLNSYGSITYYMTIDDNGEPITVYTKLAIPTLEEMLKSNDNKVREEAKRGLKQLGVQETEIEQAKENK